MTAKRAEKPLKPEQLTRAEYTLETGARKR